MTNKHKTELLAQLHCHNLMLHTARTARQRVIEALESDPPVKRGDPVVIPDSHYNDGLIGRTGVARRVELSAESKDSTQPDSIVWAVWVRVSNPALPSHPPVETQVSLPVDYEPPTS